MPRGRPATPDTTTLEAALVGLELKRTEIDGLISKIKKQLGGKSSSSSAVSSTSPARRVKAALVKGAYLAPKHVSA